MVSVETWDCGTCGAEGKVIPYAERPYAQCLECGEYYRNQEVA